MSKLDKKSLQAAVDLFAAGQAAAEADKLERCKDRRKATDARLARAAKAHEYMAALSAAEVLQGVDQIRQEAIKGGQFRDAIAASKLLLEHIAPLQPAEQQATVVGTADADARRAAKLKEITRYGIRNGVIEVPEQDN